MRVLLGVMVMVGAAAAFGASDDKFLKKYAMMKIYESCFGPEVVKEIRREMKAACAKCAGLAPERPPLPPLAQYPSRVPPGIMENRPPFSQNKPVELDHQNEVGPLGPYGQFPMPSVMPQQHEQPGVDLEKIQQALAAFYQQQQQAQQFLPQYGYSRYQPVPYGNPWMQPIQPIQPVSQPFPFFQPQFYRNRMSRDMDLRNKLEELTSRASGKVRNVTCVMQELGYLDQNLEPNFEKIAERIDNLPVSNELKSDMQDGLQFCQKFSSCVPDTKRDNSPLSKELIKPMFFFRCYKHKKLEACVMKDVRERFSTEEDLETESDFRSMSRVGKAMNIDAKEDSDEIEDLAGSLYDYLYGRADLDLESLL